ncbi:unnamed protein product, partial [Nesidiocoris tenuis]
VNKNGGDRGCPSGDLFAAIFTTAGQSLKSAIVDDDEIRPDQQARLPNRRHQIILHVMDTSARKSNVSGECINFNYSL